MDKPKYFSENQVSPEDRKAHDKLTPQMSALIIKEHVRNGLLKAREHNLPRRVAEFIAEHHGTTTIAYFYRKALKLYEESESNDPVRPEMFQYGGPPPQTRETAIALLADSVDAVSMAKLNGPTVTRDEIRRLVRDVINQKFREEQFDECNLTLRDLSKIQDAFVRALEARFHHRVKYPEAPTKRKAAQSATEVKSRPEASGASLRGGVAKSPERGSGERTAVGPERSASGDSFRATDGPGHGGAASSAGKAAVARNKEGGVS
jgi:membrane-associated HD superfamily phosphohydrolase